jgi:hypothetical protein
MTKRDTGVVSELLPSGHGTHYETFTDFLENEVQTDKGRYTFNNHAVYKAIAGLLDRVLSQPLRGATLSIKKGTQIGFSTLFAAFMLFAVAYHRRSCGYFLPDKGFAADFDQERIEPIVQGSETLTARADRDKTGARQFGANYAWVVGLHNQKGAISRPMDIAGYDEVDVIPKANRELSEERMDASDLAFQANFCRGLIPGDGIDLMYDEGCGYRWTVTCPSCGKGGQVLEDLFPACVAKVNGEWARVCVYCRKPYDVQTCGEWIAQRPELVEQLRFSFQIPQLIIPQIKLWRIMDKWAKAQGRPSRMANFYASVLALVRAGDGQPLTDGVLNKRHGDYMMALRPGIGPRFAGLDTGDFCHLWVHERGPDGERRIVWLEPLPSDDVEALVAQRRRQLGVVALVTDAKPLRSEARRMCYAEPDSTWVQDFVEEGEITVHDESFAGNEYKRVTVSRGDSLDNFADHFHMDPTEGGWILPSLMSGDEVENARTQLKLLQKARETNSKGETVIKYRRNVNNHYALAGNSALIAEYLYDQEHNGAHNQPPNVATSSKRRRTNSARMSEGYGL